MNKKLSLALAIATVATTVLATTVTVPTLPPEFGAPAPSSTAKQPAANKNASVPKPAIDPANPIDRAQYHLDYRQPAPEVRQEPEPTTGTIKNPPQSRSSAKPKMVPKPSAVKLDTVNKQ